MSRGKIKICGRCCGGHCLLSDHDDDTLPAVVGELLRQQKQTLSVAESCTGGGLGEIITQIAGSSDYFGGGVISYDNRVKVALLDVNERDLNNFGAVSAIVAQQMALGVQRLDESYEWNLMNLSLGAAIRNFGDAARDACKAELQ